jgi:hypothetical protein
MPLKLPAHIILGMFIIFHLSCDQQENPEEGLVAKVFSKTLSRDDIDNSFPGTDMENDSLNVINTFVDRWVKDQLILHHAEQELSDLDEINTLVQNYRSSLILLQYENKIIEEKLDTTISKNELQQYYDTYKDQYVLATPIIRGLLLKIPESENTNDLFRDLSKMDRDELQGFCERNDKYCLVTLGKWHFISDIIGLVPNSLTSSGSWRKGNKYQSDHEGYRYILYIEEYFKKNEVPPISYVVPQARQVILHQRRQNLLDEYKEEVYQSFKNNPNVIIY